MTRRHPPKKPARVPAPVPKSTREQDVPPQDEEGRYAPWLEVLNDSEYNSAEARLHDEIIACVSYLDETTEEQALVAHVRGLIGTTLRQYLRQCEILVYGSTDTGLRLPGSDIDMTISATDVFDTKGTLTKLSGVVRAKEWCKSAFVILGARVPIISILTIPEFGSLKLDVGINNFNGSRTGEFVKGQLKKMPALRPLVFVVKGALAQKGLNDAASSGISSYAVICMCVFFLQVNPRGLPQDHLSGPITNKSLGSILCGFLEYYSRELPYKEMYISVSGGRLVQKRSAGWITGDCADSLVMQCPCNPEQNITATLSARKFEKIRGIFGHACHVIGAATASSRNILGSLVSVDAKFIQYREHVRHLVQSGQVPPGDTRPGSGSSAGVGPSSTLASTSGKVTRRRDLHQ